MKMELIEGSETSAIRTQTPGNYPKENILHIEHGESLKSRTIFPCFFISSIAILHSSSYHLFFNVSLLSSISVNCCFVSLIIVLMFLPFLFNIIVKIIFVFHIFQYFEPVIKFCSIFLFPLCILKNIHNFSFLIIFLFSFYP